MRRAGDAGPAEALRFQSTGISTSATLPGVAAATARAIAGSLFLMSLHRPLPRDDDRDFSTFQILLMSNVPIGREEHIESCGFRGVQQLAVSEVIPAKRAGFLDDVTR